MLKFVKEGALDILALTLPASLLESIRQISEEELLPPSQVSHKQRQPRARTQKQAQEALHRRRQKGLHDQPLSTSPPSPHSDCPLPTTTNSQEKRRRRRRKSRRSLATTNTDDLQQQGQGRHTSNNSNEHDMSSSTCHQQSLIAVQHTTTQLSNQRHDDLSNPFLEKSCERLSNDRTFDQAQQGDDDEGWWRRASKLSIHSHDHDPCTDDSDYDSIDVDSEYDSDDSAREDSRGVLDLPYEVLAHILSFLPASDLLSALSVCRQWRQIALLETRQVDISECFPPDCLGLELEYSDFEFVVHLFSTFPLISTIVIKERYLRDRDLRVVTAGILAGKMAFTHWNPHFAELERQYQLQHAPPTSTLQGEQGSGDEPHQCSAPGATCTATTPCSTRIVPKIMRGSIKEELLRFSRSVATYVLVPQTRNTLRKKILAQLQANLEQKHQQDYWWMDCCFANDWGANMDLNKLPMIGLAAAISNQGLFVDLDGSYGAPSKSVKTMLGFCFGPNCVISLAFGFRHTHMELEHVTEMISENSILYRMDIVNAPAYQDLIALPALRGLGRLQAEMQRCCLELDEHGLHHHLQEAGTVFNKLSKDLAQAEEIMQGDQEGHVDEEQRIRGAKVYGGSGVTNNFVDPIEALAAQLVFPPSVKDKDKYRTAKVLLRGVISEGLKGLLSTRDKSTGQALLHTLAWRRHYSSTMAQLESQEPQTRRQSRKKRPNGSKPGTATRSTSMDSIFPSGQAQRRPSSTEHHGQAQPPAPQSLEPTQQPRPIAVPARESGFLSTSPPSLASLRAALPAALSFPLTLRRRSLPLVWFGSSPPRWSTSHGTDTEDSSDGDAESSDSESDQDGETEVERGEAGDGNMLNDPTYHQGNHDDEDEDEGDGDENDHDHDGEEAADRLLLGIPWSREERRQLARLDHHHPIMVALRMAKVLLDEGADPNVFNNDGRPAAVCASFMGFQPMETLLVRHGGVLKELTRIRETM
ncbi:hypothetical protein BGZ73_008497 [Actinomortierella ambigua]|nr:hypothetical protein BGZ73_008497 [Actinomortierella ambigua]